ncbi:MAG: ATP-binding protein [Coriobacteriales bacterium]|jgi:signal transduction histidine kinase|nr:ATP-binding protein [Coriobacteriales bacterium]
MGDTELIGFIKQVSGGTHLRVEEDLGSGFVRLRSEEAERRQAKHDIRCVEDIVVEMLRNARDAEAHAIYVATTREGDARTLTVIDDGLGIPAHLHSLVFEPRVTSKLETMVMDDWGVHGRGMALFSIRSNVDEARVVSSAVGLGTALFIRVDTTVLPEKADQSSFPRIEKDEEGRLRVVKGPHNLLRASLEFALAHRREPEIYFGSPSEIAATLLEQGRRQVSNETLLFCDDARTLPIGQRLATSADAGELLENCAHMGLVISERTAHRILSHLISPLRPLYDLARSGGRKAAGDLTTDLTRDSRGLKLAPEDVELFSREMEKAFEMIAERYYLSLSDLPSVRVKGDSITVRFPIEKE